MSFELVNVSVRIGSSTVHKKVNVAMDDAAGTAVVSGLSGASYGVLATYEGLTFRYRKASGESQYDMADGKILTVFKGRGCGCGGR